VPRSAWRPWAQGPKGSVVADLKALGLAPSSLGSLPANGGRIDVCDQVTLRKAQLFHGKRLLHLSRYPNVDPTTGAFRFLRAKGPAPGGFAVADGDAQRVQSWAKEGQPFVHGYWQWDWDDTIVALSHSSTTGTVQWSSAGGPQVKPNARYFGLNILSELDAPDEFYISSEGLLYYYPEVPIHSWTEDPVLSVAPFVVDMSRVKHVSLSGLEVRHSRATGILANGGVQNVTIENCTVANHGANGVLIEGVSSGIKDSIVFDVGCVGMHVHGGDMHTLTPGRMFADGNVVSLMARYRRTYQPALHWGGAFNTYSRNTFRDSPHTCVLGGGNEVKSYEGGVACIFEYNTFENCAYEASDVGAFYTCGQKGTAFANPGNELRHSIFRNIRNTEGSGVQGITVQAVYLDDQMSSWHVWNNTFFNCSVGTFIGGGRLNSFHDNNYHFCDIAHHFDNRGMGWEHGDVHCMSKYNQSNPCLRDKGCSCNPAAASHEFAGPVGAQWAAKWHALQQSLADPNCAGADGFVPCYNAVVNNTFCNTSRFIDATQVETDSWHSTVHNNSNASCGSWHPETGSKAVHLWV